jgi:hypothetical protein
LKLELAFEVFKQPTLITYQSIFSLEDGKCRLQPSSNFYLMVSNGGMRSSGCMRKMASTAISSYQDLWIFPVANGMRNRDTSRSLVTRGAFPTTLGNREEQHIQLMRNKEKGKNRS